MSFDTKKTVFLIDGSSFLYRAYYGLRPLHTATGIPVQAVYSFCRMIKKMIDKFNPEYIAIVWDSKGKTLRHEIYSEYKGLRQAPPSDLFLQKEYIVKFADLIGLRQVAQEGLEADDLMYSIAQEQKEAGNNVVLITSDKDLGQTIDDRKIMLYDAWKDETFDQQAFEQKVNMPVSKLPFYYALLGDASDNIPGVKGIGQKGASELVAQFENLNELYEKIDQISKPRTKQALLENKENAFLSHKLFLLHRIDTHLAKDDFRFSKENWANARPLFAELDFRSLIKDLDLESEKPTVQLTIQDLEQRLAGYDFITISTPDQLQNLIKLLEQSSTIAVDTETLGISPLLRNAAVGISVCVQPGTAYYIPFGHTQKTEITKEEIIEALKAIFADTNKTVVFHHAKFDLEVLHALGIQVKGTLFDTLIAANLITKDWQRNGLKYLSHYYFEEQMLTFAEVVKDNKYKNFSQVPLPLATRYAAADAHQTLRLKPILESQLQEAGLLQLYQTIDLPLMPVLLEMEIQGITLDTTFLKQLGKKIDAEIESIVGQMGEILGMDMNEINLNSPRQVEQLLFVRLLLPPQKKSAKRTGYSTDQEVLETLSKMHPIPGLIMKYRELTKLKTTYVDALPLYVNQQTKKIHTTFSQTNVATGRLASSDPNLQNIPTDSQGYGIEIRAAFIPDAGNQFLAADYSQIELRVLAYLSQDKNLMTAFLQNQDIHTQTASALFDVDIDKVTSAQRNIGKRINFSVLYGMTPFGLSQDLAIPFKDAKLYIERYFARYPDVLQWMENTVNECKEKGYVQTLYGRRRYVPTIYERNKSLYEEARRIAINTVVQGTAADIMKLGMIKLDAYFKEHSLPAQILLQIHDELLIQAPKDQVQTIESVTKEILENIVDWNIPLQVTTKIGHNWKEVTK